MHNNFCVPRVMGGMAEAWRGTEGTQCREWLILPEELKRQVRKFFIEDTMFQPDFEKCSHHSIWFYTRVK